MARLAQLTRWASLLLALLAGGVAWAQSFPQLHIVALAQRADRSTVEPGGTFHVTIHVKITQHRDRLDELILGSFTNCEIISNETVRTASPDGTDFVERLTLQALAPGEAVITPAYIDAIDPAVGKAMRFSSNAVRVHVSGPSPLTGALSSAGDIARRLAIAVAIVASIFAAIFVIGVLFVRRKRRPAKLAPVAAVPVSVPAPPTAAPAQNPSERLARAARLYRAERSAAALAEARAALFELAGVAAGATLIDALAALGGRDTHLRAALVAAEAAAFGPAAERIAAGDTMLAAIQAYAERRPANEGAWTPR